MRPFTGSVVCLLTAVAAFVVGLPALGQTAASSQAPAAIVVSAAPSPPAWAWQALPDTPVPFQGVLSVDDAGLGTQPMLYAAPGLAGLAVAVFAHSLVTEGLKSAQKTRMREAADTVLDPYRSLLATLRLPDLQQRSLGAVLAGSGKRVTDGEAPPADVWYVQSLPVFSMTQDQSALVLDHAISVRAPGAAAAGFKKSVRVVSAAGPKADADHVAYWTGSDGEAVKALAARLMAESIEIALTEAQHVVAIPPANSVFRTVRYREGEALKIERAQLVSASCNRALIRTLRGALMSVPVDAGDLAMGCVASVGEAATAPVKGD